MMVLSCSAMALADTRVYVDITAGSATPPNNGDDWGTDAFKYLQDALGYAQGIAASNNHVEIWVAKGTYFPDEDAANPAPNGDDDPRRSFELVSFVRLYGGFEGDETAL
jgi:hypothetical protein